MPLDGLGAEAERHINTDSAIAKWPMPGKIMREVLHFFGDSDTAPVEGDAMVFSGGEWAPLSLTGTYVALAAGGVSLGAYCALDGATDDSAGIEAAVAASNGLVLVPAGTGGTPLARVTRALVLSKNVRFVGVDRENSGFLFDVANTALVMFDGTTRAITFEHLKVRGGNGIGIKVGAASNKRRIFTNCHVHNLTKGIWISGALQIEISDEATLIELCDTCIQIDDSIGPTTTVTFRGEATRATTQGVLISGDCVGIRFPNAILEGSAGPDVQLTATASAEPQHILFDRTWFESAGTAPDYAVVTTLNGVKRVRNVRFRDCTFGGIYDIAGVNAAGSDGMIFDGITNALGGAGTLYNATGATNFHDLDAERVVLGTPGPLTAYADVNVFPLDTGFGVPTNSRMPIAISQQPAMPGRTLQVRIVFALTGLTAADAVTGEWTDDNGINPFGVTAYAAVGGDEWFTTDWAAAPTPVAGWWPTIKNATAARGSVRRVFVMFRYV